MNARRFLVRAAVVLVAWAQPARGAPEDEPIPYGLPEEETPRRPPSSDSDPDEASEEFVSELGFDDPNVGFGAELLGGLLLLESSRGGGVEPLFSGGVRAVWELGRSLSADESLREALFADVSWSVASLREGTREVYTQGVYHALTLAPAYAFPMGESAFSAYLQLGGGLSLQSTSLFISGSRHSITGVKALFQYGAGLRARIGLNEEGTLRLLLRLEVTRFRRGYMDDTLIGLSSGLLF